MAAVQTGAVAPPATRREAERLDRPRQARSRRLLLILGLTIGLGVVVLLSLAMGAKPIPLPAVRDANWSPTGTTVGDR